MKIENSLLANNTISSKEKNQDFTLVKYIPELDCNVLVVADGLGSIANSEIASEFVCENILEVITTVDELDLYAILEKVQENLRKKYNEDFPAEKKIEKGYATTLICCIETVDEFIFGYIGNGGIFHIRGDFNKFPKRFYMPWNAINLLNPHSKEEKGRNLMYSVMSPDLQLFRPSILKLRKDKMGSGDIIMLCTDGIYSYDEVQMGKDSSGKIWISGEASMSHFFEYLNDFFEDEILDNNNLEKMLGEYLEKLESEGILQDDAGIALLITPKALNYQNPLKKENENNP